MESEKLCRVVYGKDPTFKVEDLRYGGHAWFHEVLGPPGIGVTAERAVQESAFGEEEKETAAGGGGGGREGGIGEGAAVQTEPGEEELGAGEDVSEEGLAVNTAEEEEVPMGVAEVEGGGGLVGEEGLKGGNSVEGVDPAEGDHGGGLGWSRAHRPPEAAAGPGTGEGAEEERGAGREIEVGGVGGAEDGAPGSADAGYSEEIGEGVKAKDDV